MNIGVIDFDDTYLSLELYKDLVQQRHTVKKVKVDDLIIDLPQLWKKYFSGVSRVVVNSKGLRFSRERTIILLSNMLAKQSNLLLHHSRIERGLTQKKITQISRSASWVKVITPLYSKPPNITKRKK